MAEADTITLEEELNSVVHGNRIVDGNLEVTGQISTGNIKVLENGLPVMTTVGDAIQFRKACEFKEAVKFNNGNTVIGGQNTDWGAFVSSTTIQAGRNIILGDSIFKITSNERKIIADTFNMALARMDVDTVVSKKEISDLIEAKKVKVSNELIGNSIYASVIKTNKLYLENITGLNIMASNSLVTKDLSVNGGATIQNGIIVQGADSNGAAITVNGGEIVANKGIVSHTRNNRFQTLQIFGSGTDHDVCFRIDRNVDSLIEGNVTIQDSKLILDNSKLVTDNMVVTPLSEVKADEALSGVMITTSPTWDTYKDEMVVTVPPNEAPALEDDYDPVAVVNEAIERNATNYERIQATVKSIVNPINYCMEEKDGSVPKKFNVKNGLYRIDNNGNALLRNIVAEKGTFSKLEAYKFNVNRLKVDKLVTTSVASNVVDTDNLLKSRGIAEFDGVVNSSADVFIEEESTVNVNAGAKVNFQRGSELKLENGAKFEMGTNTTVKMSGDIELDLDKLVFFDSKTGRRYKISFRDAHHGEGFGIVMDYKRLPDVEPLTDEEVVEETELDARELDDKLKSLGI